MKDELVQLRREIHSHPELSFAETRTSTLAEQHLIAAGFTVKSKILQTGFYADSATGPKIAVRCEMDALPIAELNLIGYASKNANISHACGHDAHVACVIGAARNIEAPVRVIMQPGEESPDAEGITGAQHVIASGALDGIDVLVGLHVDPTLPTGTVAVLSIPTEAECRFAADISGPDLACKVEGTHRGSAQATKDGLRQSLEKLFAAPHQIQWQEEQSDSRSIDPEPLAEALAAVVPTAQISKRKTWSTSFSQYARQVPCVLLLVGCELRGDRRSQHTGRFDIDEDCLPIGAAALIAVVDKLASSQST